MSSLRVCRPCSPPPKISLRGITGSLTASSPSLGLFQRIYLFVLSSTLSILGEGLCSRCPAGKVIGSLLPAARGALLASLPFTITIVIGALAPLFSKPVFALAKLVLVGAMLAPGKRTVTAVLRVMGKSADAHFQNYHRVLNRAQWSSLEAGRILLDLLLEVFVPEGPVGMGIDETLERRRGERLLRKGLPRSGTLVAPPFRQSARAALGKPDAAGTHALGGPGVGTARSDRACPLGTV